MSTKSAIEWTETTWNPTTGCDRISPGCDHCYALTLAARLKAMGQAKYQTDGRPPTSGPGFGVATHEDALLEPLSWRKPRLVFVNSMSDLFHAKVPLEFVARVWAVMALTPWHTYQVLTKRPERMRRFLTAVPKGEEDDGWLPGAAAHIAVQDALVDICRGRERLTDEQWTMLDDPTSVLLPLANVWLGTSIETDDYTRRADELRQTPAAVRFLSCEPLLGPLPSLDLTGIGWVIVGGESGHDARPMHPGWARDLRDRCQDADVPLFVKQLGAWRPLRNSEYPPPGPTKTLHRRGDVFDPILVRQGGHNGEPEGWPADLRIREMPTTTGGAIGGGSTRDGAGP